MPKLAHSLECHYPRVPIEVIQIALHVSSFLRRQELGGARGRGNLSTDYIRRTNNLDSLAKARFEEVLASEHI